MRVLIVGKYPPIQGGVSAQTYWLSRRLAQKGHDIVVVTNAKEVEPAFRMFMRSEDWKRCEGSGLPGSVQVHYTDPYDQSQRHTPKHSPFVTKLVSLGLRAGEGEKIDVVFSFYLEPYAVAGHLIAQELGIPHVVKTAGSDIGRLWKHAQFGPFYRKVLERASLILTGSSFRDELVGSGNIASTQVACGIGSTISHDLFQPDGEQLDLCGFARDVRTSGGWAADNLFGEPREDLCYFGIYGKLARSKGAFDLLEAVAKARSLGAPIGLLVLGSGREEEVREFRDRIGHLQLDDVVVQLPFLPPWRVPEFIRRCLAVCCLEQDFPIVIHRPVIASEVLLSGGCLIGSVEVLRKIQNSSQLVCGYNCVAVPDVRDSANLSTMLAAAVQNPDQARILGRRARDFMLSARVDPEAEEIIERLLLQAIKRPRGASVGGTAGNSSDGSAQFLHRIREQVGSTGERRDLPASRGDEIGWATALADCMAAEIEDGATHLLRWHELIRVYLLVAELRARRDIAITGAPESLFRLKLDRWAISDVEFSRIERSEVWPVGSVRLYQFHHDANDLLAAIRFADPFRPLAIRSSSIAIQDSGPLEPVRLFALDSLSAEILARCAESKTPRSLQAVLPMAAPNQAEEELAQDAVRQLFFRGLIGLGFPGERQRPAR